MKDMFDDIVKSLRDVTSALEILSKAHKENLHKFRVIEGKLEILENKIKRILEDK